MKSRWIDKLFIVATILLALLLVFLFRFQKQKEYERIMSLKEYNSQIEAFSQEKLELQEKLAELEVQFYEKHAGMGTVTLLFTDLDEVVFEEILPEMKAFNMSGVLLLSEKQFPGNEGCMSQAQFQKMIYEGWEYCLEWGNGESGADEWSTESQGNDLGSWLSKMQTMLSEQKLEMPKAVYFKEGSYQKGYDATLKQYGIETAIHHGEEELPIVTVELESDTIWHPGAYPMSAQGAKEYVKKCVQEKGSMVFTIGMRSKEEMYSKNSFTSMLEQLQDRSNTKELEVMTIDKSFEYRKQLEKAASGDQQMKKMISEIEKQIEDVEMQSQEYRAQYQMK